MEQKQTQMKEQVITAGAVTDAMIMDIFDTAMGYARGRYIKRTEVVGEPHFPSMNGLATGMDLLVHLTESITEGGPTSLRLTRQMLAEAIVKRLNHLNTTQSERVGASDPAPEPMTLEDYLHLADEFEASNALETALFGEQVFA